VTATPLGGGGGAGGFGGRGGGDSFGFCGMVISLSSSTIKKP